jgi:hypothetical protein
MQNLVLLDGAIAQGLGRLAEAPDSRGVTFQVVGILLDGAGEELDRLFRTFKPGGKLLAGAVGLIDDGGDRLAVTPLESSENFVQVK